MREAGGYIRRGAPAVRWGWRNGNRQPVPHGPASLTAPANANPAAPRHRFARRGNRRHPPAPTASIDFRAAAMDGPEQRATGNRWIGITPRRAAPYRYVVPPR